MNDLISEQILDKYGVKYAEILDVQKGYRNKSYPVRLQDGSLVNLIYFKQATDSLDKIKNADSVAGHASSYKLPIRTRFDSRIIRLTDDYYAGLYHYLPGQTIEWEAYTKKHIKLLGWSMAALHKAVKNYPHPLPHVTDEYRQIFKRVDKYFKDQRVLDAIRRKLSVELQFDFLPIYQMLDGCNSLPDKQALHMDLVRGNVLFKKAEKADPYAIGDMAMSGIIDLEKVAYGHPLFDIARTTAFLLVDCPKPKHKIYKYLLDSGYRKRGQINLQPVIIDGKDLLEELITMFLIYDFYKFLRQNPYQSLKDNFHYTQTTKALLERGALVRLS